MVCFFGLDVQCDLSVDFGMNLLLVDDLEWNVQIMLQQVIEFCCVIWFLIVFEFCEDGFVVIFGWMGGRYDLIYCLMLFDEVIGEISFLVQEF